MIIFRNDKVMLMKDFGNMSVGNIYEVANITDTSVILRDAEKKIAVGAIDIDQFDQYFKKPEEVKKWTKWNGLRNASDDTIAFYRTNGKKIQVRNVEGVIAEASCNKNDEFNFYFGLALACHRCRIKTMKKMIKTYEDAIKHINSDMLDTQHLVKKMINSLELTNDKEN